MLIALPLCRRDFRQVFAFDMAHGYPSLYRRYCEQPGLSYHTTRRPWPCRNQQFFDRAAEARYLPSSADVEVSFMAFVRLVL